MFKIFMLLLLSHGMLILTVFYYYLLLMVLIILKARHLVQVSALGIAVMADEVVLVEVVSMV